MDAVGRLEHPNIVRAYDAGEDAGRPYLVMEYLEGINLKRLVQVVGQIGRADACELVRQAAIGLQYAHAQGMVHRDVKPSNLILTPPGVVKLLDLGLARLVNETRDDRELTRTGQIVGSPDFMAPEQALDARAADVRTDIYSLGCTLYFLLAGTPPFGDSQHDTPLQVAMAHITKKQIPIRDHRPDAPRALVTLLNRLLAKNPADRCATAEEVVQGLQTLAVGSDLAGLLARGAG
jgi:serine/threonine protein kinase